jgi:hypothetical protein
MNRTVSSSEAAYNLPSVASAKEDDTPAPLPSGKPCAHAQGYNLSSPLREERDLVFYIDPD